MEKVYPQVVITDKNGYKEIDYSKLTPVLVEAIKDQQKLIDELKAENQSIRTEFNSRLSKLEGASNLKAQK